MKTLSMFAFLMISIFSFNTSVAQSVKKDTIKVWGNCGMCKTKIEKAAKSAGAATASWSEETRILNVSYAVNKTSNEKIQKAIAKSGYDTRDFTADNKADDKLHACCQYERKETALTTDKKCCANETCKHDGKAGSCKDMTCCKDKTCKHDGKMGDSMGMACCKNDSCKHDGKAGSCKDMACCKDKASMHDGKMGDNMGMGMGMACCKNDSCKHDGKAGSCKDMTCCKDKTCKHDGKMGDNMGMGMACCKNETCKHDGKSASCKDMACCKEKSCCDKTTQAN